MPYSRRELRDRRLVVVDAQVDEHVREPRVAAVSLDHEQRRGLLAAPVAARRLRRRERVQQACGEAGGPHDASNEAASASTVSTETRMFPCAANPSPETPAGPFEARRAGVRRAAPGGVHDAELPVVAPIVGSDEPLDDLVGR